MTYYGLYDKFIGWTGGMHKTFENKFINHLTNLLWYLDPHHAKLKDCRCNLPNIFLNLPEYKINSIYNKFYFTGKHKKEQLSVEKLHGYVKEVESCASQPWASVERWKQFISLVLDLCYSARKYIKYLEEVNQSIKENHLSVDFIRNKIDNILIETREKKE